MNAMLCSAVQCSCIACVTIGDALSIRSRHLLTFFLYAHFCFAFLFFGLTFSVLLPYIFFYDKRGKKNKDKEQKGKRKTELLGKVEFSVAWLFVLNWRLERSKLCVQMVVVCVSIYYGIGFLRVTQYQSSGLAKYPLVYWFEIFILLGKVLGLNPIISVV